MADHSSPDKHKHPRHHCKSSHPHKMTSVKKFEKIKNWITDGRYVDTLHQQNLSDTLCTTQRCRGSVMAIWAQRPIGVPRTTAEVLKQAEPFIEQYYTSLKRANSPSHQKRWAEVKAAIERTGTYELTTAELTYGAKLAWRNAPRCIGRIQWSKLQVFDCRHIRTARGMFEAICNHLKYGTNKGNLRSAITIFPKREGDGKNDFRVWNATILRYAGYKRPDGTIIGDAVSVEFTELCIKLGWKPKYGMFDVLPMVLTANGSDPEWFELPPELVLEVNIVHPDYPWFEEMGLKWYALPGVSSMLFDCGGIEFPACPFNGWYMGTEIGARDLCDPYRYNMMEPIGKKMNLDTKNVSSLWKDKVLVEINYAVLHSFQKNNVTISDHHSACDSFMKHMEKEQKLRGGCPSDWVWLVPPISGSATQIFHQETINYKLKPSYEYQDDLLKTFVWKKDRGHKKVSNKTKRKINFRQLASAVKFSAKLMTKALARRVKCTILYATETGRSEDFAKTLCEIFKHAFDAKVYCMDEYDPASLEHESLVLVVTSTFGNGDPPENGDTFARQLFEMSKPEVSAARQERRESSLTSEIQMASSMKRTFSKENGGSDERKSSLANWEDVGDLGNVRFSVFSLGSKAYPHFGAFGKFIDNLLHTMGAERILAVGEGDELCGQEESFREWARDVFGAACDTFCVGDADTLQEATAALSKSSFRWSPENFRINTVPNAENPDVCAALSTLHNKTVMPCLLKARQQLQSNSSDRQTILVKLHTQEAAELLYEPGDHVGVYPANEAELVSAILPLLHDAPDPDQVLATEFLAEDAHTRDPQWTAYQRLPACSLRMALTYFLDLTTPLSQSFLQQLSTLATKESDRVNLETLATDSTAYEDWRYDIAPNFLEVLQSFPSLKVPPSLLLSQLPILQLRYYSISSSARMFPGEIHATITVLRYRTKGGKGPQHEGVCSGWLNKCPQGSVVPCVVRGAPMFHLPKDTKSPIMMVGPGTGIAPFRSFWEDRLIEMETSNAPADQKKNLFGDMVMYFGCRSSTLDNIYKGELESMKKEHVLSNYFVAYSREPKKPKVYVQDVLQSQAKDIYNLLVTRKGHFYVCGDMSMAHDVTKTLENILDKQGNMGVSGAREFIARMRDTNHFHEDIFGVGIRRSADQLQRSEDQIQKALQHLKKA